MDSLQPTILIVDDEKHTRDGLRRLFEDEYDTYVAEDIRGAMDVQSPGRRAPEALIGIEAIEMKRHQLPRRVELTPQVDASIVIGGAHSTSVTATSGGRTPSA